MADTRRPEDAPAREVQEIHIRKFADDTYGLIIITDPNPGPAGDKGFWIQLTRDHLEEIHDQSCALLDEPTEPTETTDEAVARLKAAKKLQN